MFLDRKPFIFLWRPIHRSVFAGAVWPFLARVKDFFLMEALAHLSRLQTSVAEIRAIQQSQAQLDTAARLVQLEAHMRELVARMDRLENEQQRQWQGTESLLLCLLSSPAPAPIQESELHQDGDSLRPGSNSQLQYRLGHSHKQIGA